MKKTREEQEYLENVNNENENDTIDKKKNDNDDVISTQEMIQDARERRENRTITFPCEQCIFTTSQKLYSIDIKITIINQ